MFHKLCVTWSCWVCSFLLLFPVFILALFLPACIQQGRPLVSDDMNSVLRSMEIVSGSVPCTDGSRQKMRRQLRALQLWQGQPSVFLALNPADTKHPFTVYYSTAPDLPWTPASCDGTFWAALKQVDLVHAAATDPVAVARVFHQHVRLLLVELLDVVASPADLPVDGVANQRGLGVFGPVTAYFGVTEPQLRGSLHVHMLLHLYAFSTPAAVATTLTLTAGLPEFATRLLTWASSLVATSLEAGSGLWSLPSRRDTLFAGLPALPYPSRQQDRRRHNVGFRRRSDVFPPPWVDPLQDTLSLLPRFVPWPRRYMQTSSELSMPEKLYDLRHSIAASCVHDCRPRTCYKGRLGRQGFCRLGFWHWKEIVTDDGSELWQRCHGLPLTSCAHVGTVPPHSGPFLTERHHPNHTRFHFGILATSKCNHDVNILVRAPSAAVQGDAAEFVRLMASSTQRLS